MARTSVTFDTESPVEVVRALRGVLDLETLVRVSRVIEQVKNSVQRREQMLLEIEEERNGR